MGLEPGLFHLLSLVVLVPQSSLKIFVMVAGQPILELLDFEFHLRHWHTNARLCVSLGGRVYELASSEKSLMLPVAPADAAVEEDLAIADV